MPNTRPAARVQRWPNLAPSEPPLGLQVLAPSSVAFLVAWLCLESSPLASTGFTSDSCRSQAAPGSRPGGEDLGLSFLRTVALAHIS